MPHPVLDAPISPLRQRLIDDMNMRRFSYETQRNYLRDIGRLASFLGRSPDTATADDLRRFQIEQQDDGVPVPTMNSIVSALRFFFTQTVDRPDLARRLVRLAHPRKLPVVLSRDEVARLLNATTCLKHQAALSVAYGAGLRVAEVSMLKVSDVDSERMLLRVERGKGGRYRNAMLSEDLLLSNRRLIAHDGNGVTFRYKDYRREGAARQQVMTLHPHEFIRRFLLHTLPHGFHRIRHYGLLASSARKECLARARELLAVAPKPEPTIKTEHIEPDTPDHRPPCPCCGGRMSIIELFARSHRSRGPPDKAAPDREYSP